MTPTDAAILRGKNAPLVLAERARATPGTVAFRSKHLGIYRERTWRDYAGLVERCARGFATLGVKAGDRVAIMGDACEEWMVCDLAAQALGAVTYGIYPTASPAEVEYQMRDGGASIFVAEDQEYVDRLLPLLGRLPAMRWIVVIDDAAMFAYDHPQLRAYEEVLESAPPADDPVPALREMAAKVPPEAPAFIVYTSGTTGHPKGALVSHGRHLAAAFNLVAHYPTLAEKAHRTAIYLPLCHVLGRDVAITLPLVSQLVPHFGEDLEDLPQTFFEVAPSVLFAVPRYLQKFASQVLVGISGTSTVKRAAYDLAARIGRAHAKGRWAGTAGAASSLVYGVARAVVFAPILNKLGLERLELVLAGGAAVPPETMALWHIWGVNVCEIYGQTETAGGIIAGQRGPFPRPGDVGTVPEGWEAKLGAENEILVRSPDLFDGYWNNRDATDAVLDADGWLHTGDVGAWADGRLTIIDRARDFIVTAGGKTLSPSHIENALRASPYVAEVVVFGHGRRYVTALVEIDYDTVSDWARANSAAYTGFTSLAQHPAVERLLQGEIDRANAALGRVEQVKRFRILPKALDPEEEGEPVTPTRKVKRKLMYERFRTLVESMYDEADERLVAAAVGELLHE
ncbi:MAG TPA: AMP-binding protein [Burkholderiales bacterium]|nr:AMP-binding protein [Burkholderiales bacterium]